MKVCSLFTDKIAFYLLLAICGFVLLVSGSSVFASSKKASDFFKNPNAKRDLIKLMNSEPTLRIKDSDEIPYFSMDSEFGVLLTAGNTDTSIAKFAVKADHELEKWSNEYYWQLLQRNTDVSSARREQVYAQLDYKLQTSKYRFFVFGEIDDNEFVGLKDQVRASLGWSHLAWSNPRNEFRYSIGPGWSRVEQQSTGLIIDEMILRLTADYTYQFESNARIEQFISAEVGEVNNRVRAQTSINAKLAERLGFKLSFEITSQEDVLRDVDGFDVQTSVSMVYHFF